MIKRKFLILCCVFFATAINIRGMAAPAAEGDRLFALIKLNNLDKLQEHIKSHPTSLNYRLPETLGGAREKGMTPLLYALSLERLAAAKILIELGADLNTANDAGVNALLMLIMVNVGDGYYMNNGDVHYRYFGNPVSPFSPKVEPKAILEIFEALLEHGFSLLNNFQTNGNDQKQNLIAEAIAHGKP